jgi:hypothetical protein
MRCHSVEKKIELFLNRELSDKASEELFVHLAGCSGCRALMEAHQHLDNALDKVSEWQVDPPPYLLQRVMANLPARMASGVFSWRVLHPIAAAASVILAVGAGFLLNDVMRTQTEGQLALKQHVRVIFYSPEASSVALVGDFNEWGQKEVTLAEASDKGIWEFTMNLEPGVYHYNLLVDGERWVANPKSSTLVPDGFGGYNSVLVVSEKCQSDCS